MKTWLKVLIVTLLFGLPTVPLGRILWPDPPSSMPGMIMGSDPTTLQLALLIGVALFEAAAFGLGVAFLLFGLPLVRRAVGTNAPLTWAACAAIAWSLLSWWPHDNLHRVAGDLSALIGIEYTFHTTLIISAAIIAFTFLRLVARAGAVEAGAPAGAHALSGPSPVGAMNSN